MEKARSPVTASCRSLLSRPSPPHLRTRPQGRRTARGPVLRARAGTAGAKLGVGKGGEVPRCGVRGAGRGPEPEGGLRRLEAGVGRGVGARRAEVRGWRLGPTARAPPGPARAARPAPRQRAPPPRAAAMAAWRVPASALGRPRPAAPPPPRDGAAFRRGRGVPLCSAAREDGGGPGPDSQGGQEEAAKRPASQELTAAEWRIVELHAAACAVRPRPAHRPRPRAVRLRGKAPPPETPKPRPARASVLGPCASSARPRPSGVPPRPGPPPDASVRRPVPPPGAG